MGNRFFDGSPMTTVTNFLDGNKTNIESIPELAFIDCVSPTDGKDSNYRVNHSVEFPTYKDSKRFSLRSMLVLMVLGRFRLTDERYLFLASVM